MLHKNYIKKFWVGLLEGDGSIQVNHCKYKYLQFRIVIKLKYTINNEKMLLEIKKVVGGYVRCDKDKEFVLWVVDHKNDILRVLKILQEYPLLSSRKICQFNFMLDCLNNPCVTHYLNTRNQKYKDQNSIIKSNPYKSLNDPHYFEIWLSGFVEAEGCFCIRQSGQLSFSITQKYEKYLIQAIQEYFSATNSLRQIHNKIFIWEISNKKTLSLIIKHFDKNPLLGEKSISFNKFKKKLKKRKKENYNSKCHVVSSL